MEKSSAILMLVITVLIIINTVIYVKFVLMEGHDFKLYLKWIPAFLLWIQTFCFAIKFRSYGDKKSLTYAKFFMLVFILCAIGDVLLVFSQPEIMYVGFVIFMLVYLVIGFSHYSDIRDLLPKISSKFCKILLIELGIFFAVSSACFIYAMIEIVDEIENYIPLVISISIYSIIMFFGGTMMFIYFVTYCTWQSVYSFFGILLFMFSDFMIILYITKYNYINLEIAIMITYWVGLIFLGYSVYKKKEDYNYLV